MAVLPCLLCGTGLEQRTTKNKKPYFVCDPCGMQIFVRRARGIDNLRELIKSLRKQELPARVTAHTLFRIKGILQEINGIEAEIEKLDSFTIFKSKTVKQKAKRVLEARLETLLSDLQAIAKRNGDSE